MKKRIFKITIVLIILLSLLINLKCFASWSVDVNAAFGGGGNPTVKAGIDNGIKESEDFAIDIISNFIILFRVVGLGIAVIILMSLGAKFIWGSVEQKAEVKKHLVVYVTGVGVLVMGAFLLGLAQDFIKGNL